MQEMNTLFVGDLSIFCEENDIQEMFIKYGELDEVKIIRCEETNKNLSYGFVKYNKHESAVLALKELNGVLLVGRPMRIGWAARKPNLIETNNFTTCDNTIKDRSSIHIFYQTNQLEPIINETYLLERFGKFGVIVDISIKRFELNQEHQFQKGYGFVHFPFTNSGLESALKCCEVFNDQMIDNVIYKCNISHRLKKSMNPTTNSYEQTTISPYEQSQYSEVMSPFSTIVNNAGNLGNYNYMIPPTQSTSMIPSNCMSPYYLPPPMIYNPYYNNTSCYGNFGLIPNVMNSNIPQVAAFGYSNSYMPTSYPTSQQMIYNPMFQHFLYPNPSSNNNSNIIATSFPQQTYIDTNNNNNLLPQPSNINSNGTQDSHLNSYWNQHNIPYATTTTTMLNNTQQVNNDTNTYIDIPHTMNGYDVCYAQEHVNYHNKQENNYISKELKNKTYDRKYKKYSSNNANESNKINKSDYNSIHKIVPIIASTSLDHNHSISDVNNSSSISSEENNSTDSELGSTTQLERNKNIYHEEVIINDIFHKHDMETNVSVIINHKQDTNHVIQKLNNLQIDDNNNDNNSNNSSNASYDFVETTSETTPLLNTTSTYTDDVVYK